MTWLADRTTMYRLYPGVKINKNPLQYVFCVLPLYESALFLRSIISQISAWPTYPCGSLG